MSDKVIVSKVLDYWFAIEFLGQDSFDTITDRLNLNRELIKYTKSDAYDKNRRKQISVYDEITGEKDIYAIISDQAKACDMNTWGNLTFFIGKIKRQVCIEKLASEFGVNLEQAEKNAEYVGRIEKVLVDGTSRSKEGTYEGRTDGFKLVNFTGGPGLEGQIVNVKITGSNTFSLTGEVV